MVINKRESNEALIMDDITWHSIGQAYYTTSSSFIMKAISMTATMLLRPKILGILGNDYLAVNSELQNYEILVYKLLFGIQAPSLQLFAAAKEKSTESSHEVGVIYRSTCLQTLLLTPVALGVCLLAPLFMQVTRQPDIVLEESKTYFLLASSVFAVDLFVNLQNRALLGLNQVMKANMTDTLGNFMSVVLAYGFVSGAMHFPALKVPGLAVALLVTKVIMLLMKFSYLMMSKETRFYPFFRTAPCFECDHLKLLTSKGIQMGMQGVLDSIAPTLLITLLGMKGKRGLIAMQAANPFSMLIAVPNFYLSQQVNLLISQSIGQENREKVKKLLSFAIALSLVYSFIVITALIVLEQSIPKLMLDKQDDHYQDYQSLTIHFLRISLAQETLNGLGSILAYTLWAHLDTRYALGSSLLFTTILTSSLSLALNKQSEEYLFALPLIGSSLSLSVLALRSFYLIYKKPFTLNESIKKEESPPSVTVTSSKRCLFWYTHKKQEQHSLIDTKDPEVSSEKEINFTSSL